MINHFLKVHGTWSKNSKLVRRFYIDMDEKGVGDTDIVIVMAYISVEKTNDGGGIRSRNKMAEIEKNHVGRDYDGVCCCNRNR